MAEFQHGNKKGEEKQEPDGLVMVVPFNSTSDLLIMSLKEYQKFKRRGDITRKNRRKKGREDL